MSIVVRPLLPDDIEAAAGVGLDAWRKGIKPLVSEQVAHRIEANNPFLPFLRESGANVLIAVDGDQIAGLAACEHGDDYISDVWVSPFHEGKGAGSALLAALEAQIAQRGYREARLEVAATNTRAASLYARRGYRTTWRATKFDPVLEVDLDKLGMAKLL